jgi:hypothetical protein
MKISTAAALIAALVVPSTARREPILHAEERQASIPEDGQHLPAGYVPQRRRLQGIPMNPDLTTLAEP